MINEYGTLLLELQKLKEELKATRKGLNKVLSKRKKWKDRYYKEKHENNQLKAYCCKRNECSGRLKENHKLTGYEIINNLEKWLEQEIGKLEEYGASFGLTIDEQISEYITDKISGYKNSLLKLRELKGSDK